MLRTTSRMGALVTTLCALCAVWTPAAIGAEPTVRFTAAGDYKMNSNTQSVLDTIVRERPQFHLALGDLAYGEASSEQQWCDFVTTTVGSNFPFQLIAGNAESDGDNGQIDTYAKCLPNRMAGMVGTYARHWYVDVPQKNPIMRVIMASPNIDFPEGRTTYAPDTAEHRWLSNAIDDARDRNIRWVVAGMHYPCFAVGKYGCTLGSDALNLLVEKRVDLVLNGHEHNYSRTHQLGYGPGCESSAQLRHTSYDADCVRDSDSQMAAGAGTVFATVGTGGTTLRDIIWTDPERPYFAALSGLNASPSWGLLSVEASATHLSAQFKPGIGTFTDSFTIGDPNAPNPDGSAIDRDGDGVGDLRDLCDARPGPASRLGCPATVRGSSLDDLLIGSRLADRLFGEDGDDTLRGRGGNDIVAGHAGNDALGGGDGNDRLNGGPGRDAFWGGNGNDVIRARDGQRDLVFCGAGYDVAVVDKFDTVRGCERVLRTP